MNVEQFFQLRGNMPLYHTLYHYAHNLLVGNAVFPLLFYFFPRIEAHPMFSIASLTKWGWRSMPSMFLSGAATLLLSFGWFKLIMTRFGHKVPSLQSPHSLQQIFVFAEDFENQWAAKFTVCGAFLPLRSTDTMLVSNPHGIKPEHLCVQEVASVLGARTIVAARLFGRCFLWKYIFSDHSRRYEAHPRELLDSFLKRLFIDLGTPLVSIVASHYVTPKVPYVKAMSPLIGYHVMRIGAMMAVQKVYDVLHSKLHKPHRGPGTFEEQFKVANEYMSKTGIVPIDFEGARGMITQLTEQHPLSASLKVAIAETLWAMKVIEEGFEKNLVDDKTLSWYGSNVQQFRKGTEGGEDEVLDAAVASPLVARQMTELTKEGSSAMFCDAQCAICLAGLEPGQRCAKISTCGHNFHAICLVRWLWRNPNCPMCRAELDSERKRAPLSVLFPIWITRFDIPRSCDFDDWDEITQHCKLRRLDVINPEVYSMFPGTYLNVPVTMLDIIGLPLWCLDLYPPEDKLNFKIFDRDPQLWRIGISTPDCPVYGPHPST